MKFFRFLPFLYLSLLLPIASFAAEKKLVIIGDSLTEGYGVAKEEAYPALLEKKLNASGKKEWRVINSGVSGSTSASALPRMKWALKAKPEAVMLALGANDGLRGVKTEVTKENLKKAIRFGKEQGVDLYLAGIQVPPNYGQEYSKRFKKIFPDLSKEEKIPLLPFLLEKVGGVPKYNLSDGIHPNEEGHKIMSQTVFEFLKDKL